MSGMEERAIKAIEAYLHGEYDLDALQAALVDETWDNAGAPQIALDADLWIAEVTSGDMSIDRLRSELQAAVQAAYTTA